MCPYLSRWIMLSKSENTNKSNFKMGNFYHITRTQCITGKSDTYIKNGVIFDTFVTDKLISTSGEQCNWAYECDWIFTILRPAQEWRRHHCRWMAAKFGPTLGAQGLWAGRDPYRGICQHKGMLLPKFIFKNVVFVNTYVRIYRTFSFQEHTSLPFS
jgi:hypothetical protein